MEVLKLLYLFTRRPDSGLSVSYFALDGSNRKQ